jgi:hypothetical protein
MRHRRFSVKLPIFLKKKGELITKEHALCLPIGCDGDDFGVERQFLLRMIATI